MSPSSATVRSHEETAEQRQAWRALRRRRTALTGRAVAAAERELDRLDERDAARLRQLEKLAPGAHGRMVELVAEHGIGAGRAALGLAADVVGLGAI